MKSSRVSITVSAPHPDRDVLIPRLQNALHMLEGANYKPESIAWSIAYNVIVADLIERLQGRKA